MRAGLILLLSALAPGLVVSTSAKSRRMAGPPVLAGWTIEASASGDLTGDGISDTAVVIRRVDPKLIIHNDRLGQQELDTNPRQLLVFERTPQGFRQIAVASKLIPPAGSKESSCLEDPLAEGGITIARKVLSVTLHYWLSCGSWGVTANTYKFRLESSRFRLIGFDRMDFMRNSGEGEEVSANYVTGRKSTTPFAIDDSIPKKLRWTRFKPKPVYLDTLDINACPQVDANTSLC